MGYTLVKYKHLSYLPFDNNVSWNFVIYQLILKHENFMFVYLLLKHINHMLINYEFLHSFIFYICILHFPLLKYRIVKCFNQTQIKKRRVSVSLCSTCCLIVTSLEHNHWNPVWIWKKIIIFYLFIFCIAMIA